MRSIVFCLMLLPLFSVGQSIHYTFDAPNKAHHEAEITLTVAGAKGDSLEFVMSKSSPGRYATHEFAKNVYNIKAVDENNRPLTVVKKTTNVFKVKNAKSVKISYTLFANRADGTYAGIARNGFQLNIPATFMWVRGNDKAPIQVEFKNVPDDWTIATQLFTTDKKNVLTAPNFQYFMDSPIKVGKLHWRTWPIKNPDGKTYTIELALEADGTNAAVDSFTTNLKKVVDESLAIFGEAPDFDNGKFTFISSINPYVYGDGMEHRNSTIVSSRNQFSGRSSLSTFAHEFFHAWNVERIRPQSLEPFKYDDVNMTEALWVAEGFTQYYTSLILVRAGLITNEFFFNSMLGLINSKEVAPGGRLYTPIENSQRAPFVDAGVSIDLNNYPNMFSSYYTYGGALGLALDLQLRNQFNKTLDQYMTALWVKYGKPEKPYTLTDLQDVLAGMTTKDFAKKWFDQYVYDSKSIQYNELLKNAGVELVLNQPQTNWIGQVSFKQGRQGIVVDNPTRKFTPIYDAGINSGDEIVSFNGKPVTKTDEFQATLKDLKIGDEVAIEFISYGEKVQSKIKIAENPMQKAKMVDNPTDKQLQFLNDWIGAKSK